MTCNASRILLSNVGLQRPTSRHLFFFDVQKHTMFSRFHAAICATSQHFRVSVQGSGVSATPGSIHFLSPWVPCVSWCSPGSLFLYDSGGTFQSKGECSYLTLLTGSVRCLFASISLASDFNEVLFRWRRIEIRSILLARNGVRVLWFMQVAHNMRQMCFVCKGRAGGSGQGEGVFNLST